MHTNTNLQANQTSLIINDDNILEDDIIQKTQPTSIAHNEDYKDFTATSIYLKSIHKSRLLNKQEEQHYAYLLQKGDITAKNQLIESNLRLVIKIARRYLKSGMPFLDLISEGNIGLIKAVEKFDPNLDFRFSTYAAWWIQQNIERAIMYQQRTIRLPVHIAKKLNSLLKVTRKLNQQSLKEPSITTLAHTLKTSKKEIKKLQALNEHILSMDFELSTNNSSTLTDLIGSHKNNAYLTLQQQRVLDLVNSLLQKLPAIQREVISKRFGLHTNDELTLEETGSILGLTREKVRNLQKNAIELVKEHVRAQGLQLDNFI